MASNPDSTSSPSGSSEDATQFLSTPGMAPPQPLIRPQSPTIPTPIQLGPDLSLSEDVTLGEFRLLRRLGRGGMSEVYLAEQTLLKRHVAIKVLRPELMLDETLRQRFQKEALAVAGLNHPNIVQVYTVGESNSRFYIAQEYVNGQNLREYLSKKGPPDLPVALHIMKQVAAALHAAGQAGIVHRDIKPENIMLARKGDVKVADFGLAKRSQQSDTQQLTQYGHTMGTPLYMSPEQVNGRSVDQRSDLYSFGVTCYHMLAGHPPFRGDNAITIAVQHLRETPKPLESIREDLPPLLCRIIHKLMEKDPDDRYQSAAALLKDLKRLGSNKEIDPKAQPADDRPIESGPRESRSKRVIWSLGHPIKTALWISDQPLQQIWSRLLIVSLIVMALSAGVGWIARPENPLKIRSKQSVTSSVVAKTPVKKSASEQYFLATSRKEDKAGWKAVIENFPDDKIFTPASLIELGVLYLADRQVDEAKSCFDRLVAYGSLEPKWQSAGWLGQASVLSQQQQFQQSQDLLREKSSEMVQHLSPRLRAFALSVIDANERQLRQGIDDSLRRFRETAPN